MRFGEVAASREEQGLHAIEFRRSSGLQDQRDAAVLFQGAQIIRATVLAVCGHHADAWSSRAHQGFSDRGGPRISAESTARRTPSEVRKAAGSKRGAADGGAGAAAGDEVPSRNSV